jgi:hypothetical protein
MMEKNQIMPTELSRGAKAPFGKESLADLLAIKRESIWNVASLAEAHIKLMLGSLEIADDVAAYHHGRCFVDRARAVAALVRDLDETRCAP